MLIKNQYSHRLSNSMVCLKILPKNKQKFYNCMIKFWLKWSQDHEADFDLMHTWSSDYKFIMPCITTKHNFSLFPSHVDEVYSF